MVHQPCWGACLSSHGFSLPQGSEMPLLHFWGPCASSVNPPSTLLPHAIMQRDTGISNAFSIHIPCFTTAPAPFPCHKPCSLLHIPSSPHSPSSGLSRHSPSQQFAECCGGRLCGNDSCGQGCWHLGRSTSLFQPLQGALGGLKVLKIQTFFSQRGREGVSQGSDHLLNSHEETQICQQTSHRTTLHRTSSRLRLRLCSQTTVTAEGRRCPAEHSSQQPCPTNTPPQPTPSTGTQPPPWPGPSGWHGGNEFLLALLSAGTASLGRSWG